MAAVGALHMLMHDHRLVEKALSGLGLVMDRLNRGDEVDVSLLRETVQFMRQFVDRCHHRKEEELLFPAMARNGVPEQGGPLGVMKHEHEQGRAWVATFEDAVELYAKDGEAARDRLVKAIGYIRELYTDHISKEERVLFPMAERILSAGELDDLLEGFNKGEAETGSNVHERFERFAERLLTEAA